METRRTIPLVVAALAVVLAGAADGSPARRASSHATVDVYPIAGTKVANPQTTISFRGSTHIKNLTVTGSRTKTHAGHLVVHSDGKGVSFVPDHPFAEDEQVKIHSSTSLTGADSSGDVQIRTFRTPDKQTMDAINGTHTPDPEGDPAGVQHFHSRKDLRPPDLKVTTNDEAASNDPIFLAVKAGPGQNGPEIRDARGRLIWFRHLNAATSPYDFRAQEYRGHPVLTWWEGELFSGKGKGHGVMLDSSYHSLKSVYAGNGYAMDQHEFQLSPRGTAFINVYEPVRYSLRPAGGPKNGNAWDSIVQEIDIKTGMVLFEWHSLAHVSVGLSTFPYRGPSSTHKPYDPFHVNSVSEDGAGNLLLSSRNTDTLFLVDRHNGRVLSRIGGKKSDYEMEPGAATIGQHQATIQPDGTITAFDNGASTRFPTQPNRPSRGVRIQVDATAGKVFLVKDYHHPGQELFSNSQGSMQVLSNGDVFLSWGDENPYLTELTAGGQLVFESHIDPTSDDTYRAYRLPWRGTPRTRPDVIASTKHGTTDVYASWNGATEVARWEVLAGSSKSRLSSAGTFAKTDFETHLKLPGVSPKYVEVRALDSDGHALSTSSAVAPKQL